MHSSDRLSRAVVKCWTDLCVDLGDCFSVSEAAISHLFVHSLLSSGHVVLGDICPEDYYVDRAGGWRRVDLLLGTDLLYETGKKRAVRKRLLSVAVEFKIESQAVVIQPRQIEQDAAKLQELAEDQRAELANFNVLVLFRSMQDQGGRILEWKQMSSRYDSVRFVISFPENAMIRVLHFHRGKCWDVGKNDGHFYAGWPLKG